MKINGSGLTQEILAILHRLGIDTSDDGIQLIVDINNPKGISVKKTEDTLFISVQEKVAVFRALGLAAEQATDLFTIEETEKFKKSGVMLDCSRNAVPTVKTVQDYIEQLAIMGFNTFMLYTEDTYEIKDEPYFGYMRGRFTESELKAIDDYAYSFGIEVIPCIQTLAHLNNMFQWRFVYRDIWDIDDIMMIDEEKTYELVEKMIVSCRNAFRSNRIHIGMDEAENLGRGRFKNKNGNHDAFDLFCKHLNRVKDICNKYGFSPIIWSDMFFKMAKNETGDCYDQPISNELLQKIPENVDMVYWDYCTEKSERVDGNCKRHAQFINNHTIFAGAGWRFTGYAPRTTYSLDVSRRALEICYDNHIDETLVTLWGDNGAEADLFAAHPVVQLFAEMRYDIHVSNEKLQQRFKTCTKANFDDILLGEDLDSPLEENKMHLVDPSRYLLYQDILSGLFDKHVTEGFNAYYEKLAAKLNEAKIQNPYYENMFAVWENIAKVLSIKAEIGLKLHTAYMNSDKALLKSYAENDLNTLLEYTDGLHKAIQTRWLQMYKPFGYEILDIRLSGIKGRIKYAQDRLSAFAENKIDSIPELEEEQLTYNGYVPGNTYHNVWRDMISASGI